MWVCTNQSFVSIVADKDHPDMLLVRARKREHLKTLFPKAKITMTTGTDYRYRTWASRGAVASLIATQIANIDYSNFKGSVGDFELHNLYLRFWFLHREYQDLDALDIPRFAGYTPSRRLVVKSADTSPSSRTSRSLVPRSA